MPIMRPDGPGVDTKGASNTKCVCFVHTHDRGENNPSQVIDLSPYITSIGVSSHLAGGGSASITLPAVDYIEDILAAGDIINIYFNTNRSNENIYNVGLVRTFFGYIDSISQSISVGPRGEKLTTYSISCKDFSKAIRSSYIYNNEHLASQSLGDSSSPIRKDLGSNLGGIGLISQGIAMEGRPRKAIIQNLLRFIGFGGQWALPLKYKEMLPNSSTVITRKKETSDKETVKDIFGIKDKALAEETATREPILSDLAWIINELRMEEGTSTDGISDKWNAVTVGGTSGQGVRDDIATKIRKLKGRFKKTVIEVKFDKGKGGIINNTFFKIRGIDSDQYRNNMRTLIPDKEVTTEEQGLQEDIKEAIERALDEIEAFDKEILGEESSFPKANQYAQPLGAAHKTAIKTIFNILCLDYLEDVDGYWASHRVMHFQGSLFTALQDASNSVMNELFFDLRPSPLFQVTDKDGLGVPMEGAMPMVPAVVLRLKPFTNYQNPKQGFESSEPSIVVGGWKKLSDSGRPIAMSDQLVVNTGGALGDTGPDLIKSTSDLKDGDLTKIMSTTEITEVSQQVVDATPPDPDTDVLEREEDGGDTAPAPDPKVAWEKKIKAYYDDLEEGGTIGNSPKLVDMIKLAVAGTGIPKPEPYIAATTADAELPIARKTVSNFITLPRPIFRSPDNNRITKELDLSQNKNILGVMKDGGTGTDFFSIDRLDSEGWHEVGVFPHWDTRSWGDPLVEGGTDSYAFQTKAEEVSASSTPSSKEINWHILDYMTVNDTDVKSENYTRGDFDVANIVEFWGGNLGNSDSQRFFLGTVMPLVTPLSVYRFGIRPWTQSTKFVQALFTGGVDHSHQRNILLRWVVLQDLWLQHNHELMGGSMNVRGMPGLRVGYRVDRPERNMSVYVDQVSHTWSYPGELSTSIGFSRGQPMGAVDALPYAPPISNKNPENTSRQNLGKVFKTSEFTQNGQLYRFDIPGTFTGPKGVGRQIKVEKRTKIPIKEIPPGGGDGGEG